MSSSLDQDPILPLFSLYMQSLAYSVVVETFVYGLYTGLFILSAWFLLRRKFRVRGDIFIFAVNAMMWLTATVHWGLLFAYITDVSRWYITYLTNLVENPEAVADGLVGPPRIVNDIDSGSLYAGFINFVLNDCVVIWRAWLVSGPKAKKWIVALGVSSIVIETAFFIVAMSLPSSLSLSIGRRGKVSLYIVLSPTAYYITLSTNIWATAVIAWKAWQHRQLLQRASFPFGRSSQAAKVLILLLESGGLYCIIWAFYLVLWAVDLATDSSAFVYPAALSILYFDILGLCMVYYAGMYPSIIIVLVCLQRSFGETVANYSGPSNMPTPTGLTVPTEQNNDPASVIRSRVEPHRRHPSSSIIQIGGTFMSGDLGSVPRAEGSLASPSCGPELLHSVVEIEDSSSEGHHIVQIEEKKEEGGLMV